jgi:hypothetical protein
MDIILASLLPSYETLMDATITSLEECGCPVNSDNIIRILKSHYDKKKAMSTTQEDEAFVGTSQKKQDVCHNCQKKGHTKENCWGKGGGKEGQGHFQKKKEKKSKKKKKGKDNANVAEESDSDNADDSIAFMNFDCTALIKDNSGATEILDTGASSHMTPYKELLVDYKKFSKPRQVRAVNKGTFEALGTGMLVLPTKIQGINIAVSLKDTLYAPKIAFTLISIGRGDNAGYQTVFSHQKCIVKDSAGKTLIDAPKFHGLYRLDHEPANITDCPAIPAIEMHKKLAHTSYKSIKYLFDHGMVLALQVKPGDKAVSCDVCIKAKITCKSFPKYPKDRASNIGDKVYWNVWGPARHPTIDKKTYYVSFTDDFSRESVIYLMRTED